MKLSTVKLILLTTILFSCKEDFAQNRSSNATNDNLQSKIIENGYQYFENFDNTVQMASSRIKLPKNWKRLTNDPQYLYNGPNNMRIGKIQMSSLFSYTTDPSMLQTYQFSGVKNSYPLTINQIVEQYFKPYANEHNMRLVNIFPLPKVAEKGQQFLEMNFTTQPTQIYVESAGLEWEDNQGKKYLTIIRKNTYTTHNQLQWGFMNQHIESDKSDYENAKKIFIDMTLSEQYNTHWLNTKNQIAARKANQRYQAHQARMNALRLRNNNSGYSSADIGKTYSDILDINHSGYLKRNAMNSQGQTRTINAIGERNVISNYSTGERYTVQSGSKYYWVNNDGKYFGTDNPNYDPRTDNRINNVEWSQFQIDN